VRTAASPDAFYGPHDLYVEGLVPLALGPSEGLALTLALMEVAQRGQPLPFLKSVASGLAYGVVRGGEVTEDGLRLWGRVDVFPEVQATPGNPLAQAVNAIRAGRWRGMDVVASRRGSEIDLIGVKLGPTGAGTFTAIPPETRRDLALADLQLTLAETLRA
jgi:hypothetical protein